MNKSKHIGLTLMLVGTGLLLFAVASFIQARGGPARQAEGTMERVTLPAPASLALTRMTPVSSLLLGPTAQAAATLLPQPTAIPTAGPIATRPSAAVRIVIPAVGIDAHVVEVRWHVVNVGGEAHGIWDTVAGAAGHHRGSADPGQRGNCVLSAHSSDAGGAAFRRLGELVSGDLVELYTAGGQRYEYVVTAVLTLDEVGATLAEKREHARWLDPTDEPVLTLVTCWPAWSYTHRIVVRASLRAS